LLAKLERGELCAGDFGEGSGNQNLLAKLWLAELATSSFLTV
jgi:hypothetical protein